MEYICIQTPEDTPVYGEFVIRDMMPGMGTVVGTAMRRVLLSSVPGTAVTWVRIEGVLHEFSTIPGVKEDVSQLLLAVRKLTLRVRDRNVHSLYLNVKGRDAYAGDLTSEGGVEILDPSCKLATINRDGHLKMELWVQAGRDHAMDGESADPRHKRRAPIGMIWADPIYSPVKKVSLEVEEEGDREHLRLCVRTNGTVSPREAVDWSGRILSDLMGNLERLSQPPKPVETKGRPLEVLGLSARAFNRLKRARFHTVEAVLVHTRQELWDTPALGPKTLVELEEKLSRQGLHLAEEIAAG